MDGPGSLLVYGAVKLLGYSAWCWQALRMAGRPELLARAVGMGLLRWLIGLVLGVLIFFAVPTTQDQVFIRYIAIYVPVRIIEWLLLSACVLPSGAEWSSSRRVRWIVGGILLSFLTDLVSPDMLQHGHFCVGRCLC